MANEIDVANAMPCPICKGADVSLFAHARDMEYFTGDQTYTYLECRQCGAVYLDRPPVDRLHEIYPANYYSYAGGKQTGLLESVKQQLDARIFRKLLERIPGERLSVLDIGGGAGWLLSLVRGLTPRVAETHQVEITESARAAAEAEGHQFHCVRIEEFRTTQRFDLILMLNLIEHVADPRAVLQVLSELVTPGGLILIKTPNTDTLDRRLFQHNNWGGLHCPRHWVLFTMPGFARLAGECGLEVVEAKYTQGGSQWASSVMAYLAAKGWISLSADRPMSVHPLLAPMLAAGAAIDFVRMPFANTAQMFFTLRQANPARTMAIAA
jgi:2-polyprenyl-3-methyl-5-hydroxy-6-metoxy-1,4-benzoquinol methylase